MTVLFQISQWKSTDNIYLCRSNPYPNLNPNPNSSRNPNILHSWDITNWKYLMPLYHILHILHGRLLAVDKVFRKYIGLSAQNVVWIFYIYKYNQQIHFKLAALQVVSLFVLNDLQ